MSLLIPYLFGKVKTFNVPSREGHGNPPFPSLLVLKQKHSGVLQNLSTMFQLHHFDHSHFFNDHLFQQNLQLSQGKWAECLDPTASSARIQILLPLLEICHSKYFQDPMVLSASSQTSITTIKFYHHIELKWGCGNHITALKNWKIPMQNWISMRLPHPA